MKQTITKGQFRDAFNNMGRGDQFSYEALGALFDYMEELETDMGSEGETELDVIALCCEFTEYADLEELQGDYSDIEDMDDLGDYTTIIPVSGDSFIIQQF